MAQISVIVPVYNAEKTLHKCLDSIKNQTFENFEVILINDGSKDKSQEICEEYCQKDARFKLFNIENSGPSNARNKGIDEADSEYLAFVDSDDYIELNMLEELFGAAEASLAELTICGFYNEENNVITSKYAPRYAPGIYRGEQLKKIVLEALNLGEDDNIRPYSCIRLVKKEALENPRIRFNTNIHRSEDYLLWNILFSRIKCLCLITDKPLYHYIMNSTSITHNYMKNYWDMSKIIYNELKTTYANDKEIIEQLNIMHMRRACMALNIAKRANEKKHFTEDVEKILSDKELQKAIDTIPLSVGIKKENTRYLLFKFRLHFIIRLIFNYRYAKKHRK